MNRQISVCTRWAVLFVTATLVAACGNKNDAVTQAEKKDVAAGVPAPRIEQTKAIAEEGFIYGLPLVMNYAVMNEFAIDTTSSQFKAPFNEIKNEHRVATYEDTAVITPNSDTPYSMLWADLRAEPLVVSVPAVEKKRYYSVQLIDGNTYNFGYIGSRATGPEAGDYLIAGPDWKAATPVGIKKVFTSTTPFALVLFRTQLFNPADMPNVQKVQAGYKAQPLSTFLKQAAPPAAPKIDFVPATTAGIKDNFFEYLSAALEFVPPSPDSMEIRAKLASIGVGPGKTFEFKDLSPEHKAAVVAGHETGRRTSGQVSGQWFQEHQRLERWCVLWRPSLLQGELADACWRSQRRPLWQRCRWKPCIPYTRVDATGETLDGSKHNYTITFPYGQLPPVNAFWSVTMYDGKSQFLIKNPINRYLINSPMLPSMKRNADGSLTLYIQKDSPGKAKEANWLPAPNDTIYMVMRLYWPKDTPPSILPPGVGTWKPPGIVAAK